MTAKDRAFHTALMKILDEATFELKAREVAAFAQVYTWAKDLDKLLEKTEEAKPPIKKKTKKKATSKSEVKA